MFYYQPTDGEICNKHIKWLPRTCFLMFQQGGKVPPILAEARNSLISILEISKFSVIDANGRTTGRDFLHKIWEIAASVPIGFAFIHEKMNTKSMANIFYELGMMQSLGKETLVIKIGKAKIPSDFVRTEYVDYGNNFTAQIKGFLESIEDRAEHYIDAAYQLRNNPLIALDYLKRAFLLTNDSSIINKQQSIIKSPDLPTLIAHSITSLYPDFSRSSHKKTHGI